MTYIIPTQQALAQRKASKKKRQKWKESLIKHALEKKKIVTLIPTHHPLKKPSQAHHLPLRERDKLYLVRVG
jgi:hypothetical protein